MDPILLSLFVAKIILINTKNLIKAIDKAKSDDGKVTADEIPGILVDTAIKSLDDLRVNLRELGT